VRQLRTYMRLVTEVRGLPRPEGIRACWPQQTRGLCGPCRNTGSEHAGLTPFVLTPVSPSQPSQAFDTNVTAVVLRSASPHSPPLTLLWGMGRHWLGVPRHYGPSCSRWLPSRGSFRGAVPDSRSSDCAQRSYAVPGAPSPARPESTAPGGNDPPVCYCPAGAPSRQWRVAGAPALPTPPATAHWYTPSPPPPPQPAPGRLRDRSLRPARASGKTRCRQRRV
jgi:hypothetical protein